MNDKVRLNKYLADAGVCSRRAADQLIVNKQVMVNGEVVNQLGSTIDPTDQVSVNDQLVTISKKKIYIALNKPLGVVSSSNDEKHRQTVISLMNIKERIFTVGRLDVGSEGLILITNDGDFCQQVIHPSKKIEKEYQLSVRAESEILNSIKKAFSEGLTIDGKFMRVDKIKLNERKGDTAVFNIVIHQGYNRQLRKMSEAIGARVINLKRIRIGNLKLGELKSGKYRYFQPNEVLEPV